MTNFVLAIDLGTGSVKTGLITRDGVLKAQASARYPVVSPEPGWSETDPREWWAGVVKAVQAAMQGVAPEQVCAVSFSGQMHGVVLTDAEGTPLGNAVLWSDTRSSGELGRYARLSPAALQRLRNPVVAGFAGPTLLWLRKHEPEMVTAARWALQPKDWLRFHLTGQAFTEPSDASGTLLCDVTRDTWDDEVIGTLGLDAAKLPPLLPSQGRAGELNTAVARQLGLRPGIPVMAGAADTAAALLGSGLRAGEAQLTVGTGAQVVVASDALPDGRTGLHIFRDALSGFYTLAAVQNAGNVLEWARTALRLSWPEMYVAAQAVDGQPSPLFLPYLTGDRTPHLDPYARAGWLGLDASHDHRHMAYAAFEGVALAVAQAARLLDLPAGQPLKLAGGGTLDPWWQHLLADALKRELHVIEVPSASLLGAAKLAWLGLGVQATAQAPEVMHKVQPRPERISAARHERFNAAYQALRPWFSA